MVSVNGVGDTFLGVILGRVVEMESDLSGNGKMVEFGESGVLDDIIGLGQQGAVETLKSEEAVGRGVRKLRAR